MNRLIIMNGCSTSPLPAFHPPSAIIPPSSWALKDSEWVPWIYSNFVLILVTRPHLFAASAVAASTNCSRTVVVAVVGPNYSSASATTDVSFRGASPSAAVPSQSESCCNFLSTNWSCVQTLNLVVGNLQPEDIGYKRFISIWKFERKTFNVVFQKIAKERYNNYCRLDRF